MTSNERAAHLFTAGLLYMAAAVALACAATARAVAVVLLEPSPVAPKSLAPEHPARRLDLPGGVVVTGHWPAEHDEAVTELAAAAAQHLARAETSPLAPSDSAATSDHTGEPAEPAEPGSGPESPAAGPLAP